MHRGFSRKARGNLDHGLVDEHRHGVEVAGKGLQPQALGLQGDGPSSSEGVVQAGEFVGVEEFGGLGVVPVQGADLAPRPADLLPGLLQHRFVGGVLPEHQFFEKGEEALPLSGGVLFVHAVPEARSRAKARIVHQGGEDHRPGRRQRAPGPPEVQGTRVAVADGFFPGRRLVDLVQRKGHLDEFSRDLDGRGHVGFLSARPRRVWRS